MVGGVHGQTFGEDGDVSNKVYARYGKGDGVDQAQMG